MPEGALRLASLIVLGGPLKGRRHDLEEVVAEVLIGADESCHLTVDQPSISPIHARLWCDLNEVTVYDTRAPSGLYLNDDRVSPEAKVRNGDVLWLGAPGDPESVGIQCHFEPWVEVLPGSTGAEQGGGAEAAAAPASPSAEDEPLFVGELPGFPEAGPAVPPEPEAPAPPPTPSQPEALPSSPGQEDPFFVGEAAAPAPSPEPTPTADDEWAIADAAAPPAPESPASPPEAPAPGAESANDAFFISEDSLTVGPDAPESPPPAPPEMPSPPPPASPPASSPPVAEEVVEAEEVIESAEIIEGESVPQATPASAPGPDGSDRAPLPPRKATQLPPSSPDGGAPPPPAEPPPRPAAPRPPAARGRPPAQGARRPRPAAARRPARRPAGGGAPEWLRPLGLGALAAVALAAIGAGLWMWLGSAPTVEQVTPQRVRVGQRAILSGSGFSEAAAANTVVFGNATANVLSASATRLEVEVPEAVVEAGAERRVPVVVRRGDRESEPVEVAVFAGPRLHGLSPDVAMPGEEVLLAGAGWGVGATVRFGDLGATILEVEPTQIRAVVPALPTTIGTPAPVVVTVGGVDSNPAPFFVGRLPLITGVAPTAVSMGDTLTVSGRGFQREAALNNVTLGGVPALVVAAFDDQLQVVVPRPAAGQSTQALELRVPDSGEVGRALLQVSPVPDPIPLRFVAEPFPGAPSSPFAVVSSGLGPAFVLSAANGRSGAQRALAAQEALNAAAAAFATSPGLLPEARDLATRPAIALPGRPEPVLEVTAADASAYNEEDWTQLRGRGGPVTPARLARWWEAVCRDLFVMLGQNRRPSFAAALAPEGQVLQQVFDAGAGSQAVPLSAVTQSRRGVSNGLRLVALRVPASVTAASASTQSTAAAAVAPAPTPEPLDPVGTWSGSEVEGGRRRYLTLTFKSSEGTIAYEGGITLTVPFLSYDRPSRNEVHFAVQIRGGMRHYHGAWDGETLSGNITRDQAGEDVTGDFEVRKR